MTGSSFIVDSGGNEVYPVYPTWVFRLGREKSSGGHLTSRRQTCFFKASNGAGHRGSRSRGEQCGRSELARQAARPPRRSVPPSTSRRQLLVGTDRRRKLTSSCGFELRLLPQLDTPSPLGRGSSHAPRTNRCIVMRGGAPATPQPISEGERGEERARSRHV